MGGHRSGSWISCSSGAVQLRNRLAGAALGDRLRGWLVPAAALLAAVVLAYPLAERPFIVAGLVVGGALLALTLLRPLVVVALMLLLGPIDLSFVTGGDKSLFAGFGGLDMNGIRLIGLVVSFLGIVAVDRNVLRHALAVYGRWYLAFLAFAGATIFYSPAPIDGARLLLKLGYPFLICILVLGLARSRSDLEWLSRWALAGAVGISLINPLFVLAGGYDIDGSGRIRVQGVGVHENPFSFYLLIMLLFSFSRYLVRGKGRYLALCAMLGGWMVMTLTRIALAAAMVGLVGVALYDALVTRRYRTVALASVVGVLLAIPFLPVVLERSLGYTPGAGELLGLLTDPVGLYHMMNWQGRQVIWPMAVDAFLSSPLVGIGLGGSTGILMSRHGGALGGVMHNEYLRLLVDTGLIGTVIFALAVVLWGGTMVRLGRGGDGRVREFALPAFAGILAWGVLSLTDNVFDYYAPFTQYIGFLCAAAIASGELSEGTEDGVSNG